jgi:hypothetical protein
MLIVLQPIMGEFTGEYEFLANRTIKFVILQILPYHVSGATEAACLFQSTTSSCRCM